MKEVGRRGMGWRLTEKFVIKNRYQNGFLGRLPALVSLAFVKSKQTTFSYCFSSAKRRHVNLKFSIYMQKGYVEIGSTIVMSAISKDFLSR